MTDFGDSEPEDAWHPDDPVEEQLDNIRRRIILLAAAAAAQSGWGDRERRRADLVDEDLLFVLQRIRNG